MTIDTPDAAAVQAAIERANSAMEWSDTRMRNDCELLADACEHYQRELAAALARERGLREALEQIRDMEPHEFTGFPADWQKQVEECSECQRYKGHPIQNGICDKHREPIWARESHAKREGGTGMRFRMLDIARAALAAEPTHPKGT